MKSFTKYEAIEFAATDGTVLRGRLYRPKDVTGPGPLVVLAGGFASVTAIRNFAFAEHFAAGGVAALAFDYRNFGLSDAPIPGEVDPFQQVSDLRDAITYAQSIDRDRSRADRPVGLELGGGHAVFLTATDRRVKCVVAQVPFVSGSQTTARQVRADMMVATRAGFAADRAARWRGERPRMIPVFTPDPMKPAVLPTQDAWHWMQRYLSEDPTWKNEVTLRSLEGTSSYEPGAYVTMIAPTPLLVIVGRHDNLTPPDLALRLYERALQPKQLVLIDGGHFDAYDVLFDKAAGAALDWFTHHLA